MYMNSNLRHCLYSQIIRGGRHTSRTRRPWASKESAISLLPLGQVARRTAEAEQADQEEDEGGYGDDDAHDAPYAGS